MKINHRRRFLTTLGATLVAGAWCGSSMRSTHASTKAKRLVVVFTPNGTIHEFWRPKGSGKKYSFPAGSILEPLEPYKDRVVICDGIDFVGTHTHEGGIAAMLTGGADTSSETRGMSLDQYAAKHIGQNSRFASLEFGVQTRGWGGGLQTNISYLSPTQLVPADDDPASMYRRIFGDSLGTPAQIDAAWKRRVRVLDHLRSETKKLRGRVTGREQEKLDRHLDSLDALEVELQTTLCPAPEAPPMLGTYDNDSFPLLGQIQMDLLVKALSCQLTRVALLQWNHTLGPLVMSWLGLTSQHHDLSHSEDNNPQGVSDFVTAERWYTAQFVSLLDRLATTPDPEGGFLLDSTLVVWCKELGDSRTHECKSVPFVLAGGGGLAAGQYLNFGGVAHNRLLVSICHALGLSNETFGDPQKGHGILPELFL